MGKHVICLRHLFVSDPLLSDWILEQEINKADGPLDQCDLVILLFGEPLTQFAVLAFTALNKYKFKSVTFIADRIFKKSDLFSIISFDYTIHIIDYWAIIAQGFNTQVEPKINNLSGPGLLLTGRLDRLNRITLLKKMYDKNNLKNIRWSYPSITLSDQINKFLNEQHRSDYKNFLSFCKKNAINCIDEFAHDNKDYSIYSLSNQYRCTGYSIISESIFSGISFITEKTYRAILECHPYIMASSAGTLALLESMGFKTFANYLLHPSYDLENNDISRLDLIVENIVDFPNKLVLHKKQIQEDILHNWKHLQTLCNIHSLLFCNLVGIEGQSSFDYLKKITELNSLVNTSALKESDEYKRRVEICKLGGWLSHYNQIKADDWPDITTENEFYQLSIELQTECIDIFGFQPGVYLDQNNPEYIINKVDC